MSVELSHVTAERSHRRHTPTTSDRIALIDADGTIVAVDKNWSDLGMEFYTFSNVGVGVNYLDLCRGASATCDDALEALTGIQSVLKGKSRSFVMDYTTGLRNAGARFRMIVTPFDHEDARAAIVHIDLTEIQASREKSLNRAQDLARRLIRAQEEERERIAREIHDDLGNRIALLSFSVQSLMKRRQKDFSRADAINEILLKIKDLSDSLRHLSHSLHPHLLRHFGVCTALKVLCDEFDKASGIHVELDVPDKMPPLSDESGLCIFRVAQECLQNIVKHSAALTAHVALQLMPRHIRLTVTDTGRGFVQSTAWDNGGLGLTNMKERVLCMEGQLEIRSTPGLGTRVLVTIPRSEVAHN